MNTQSNSVSSVIGSPLHVSPSRYRRPQLGQSTQTLPRRRSGADSCLNAAAFERFLYWLGPDPEAAGQKYESIRVRLIMMFRARRCVFAEDLADATFERVARRLPNLTTEFSGDPARYFYGVAKKIYLEYQRHTIANHQRTKFSTPTNNDNPDLENMLKQLDEALSVIPESDRELILTYYTGSGENKINHRRALAAQFGLRPSALRLRVFRIRREIKNYMSRSRFDNHSQTFLSEMTIQTGNCDTDLTGFRSV